MNMRIIVLIFLMCHVSFAFDLTSDSKNVYFQQGHFRVIAGVSFVNDMDTHTKAQNMLEAAILSWTRCIDVLGFLPPRNSATKTIDIYMANTLAYNHETGVYETLPSSFGGWATSYPSDNTPYFLLNTSLNDEQLKVTIAHEFFHMIQYAYFNESNINDEKWFKNIWWLEATAMLMEDEVFDEVDDYISFAMPFFIQSYKNVEIYDGNHEYAMVVYAKFIKEKYGFQIIKESLQRYESSWEKGFFEILDDLLQESHASNIKAMLVEFGQWVYAPHLYFEEGAMYPSIQKFALNDNTRIEKGGIAILEGLYRYSVVSAEGYIQAFATTQNKIVADGEDIIVGNVFYSVVDGAMLGANQLEADYISEYSSFYRYDSLQGKYFWKVGELILNENIFIKNIILPYSIYELEGVRCVTRQKIDL